jgi:hypothetical protein
MLRYFKKSETLYPGEDPIGTSLRGVDGPVTVSAFIKHKKQISILIFAQVASESSRGTKTSLNNFIADTYKSIGVAHAIDMNGVKLIDYSEIYSSVCRQTTMGVPKL